MKGRRSYAFIAVGAFALVTCRDDLVVAPNVQPLPSAVFDAGPGTLSVSDGRIVIGTSGGITVMNADGSNAVLILSASNVFDPSWSPDGEKIAFGGTSGIYVVNKNGLGLELLATDGTTGACYRRPRWSPDGTKIAFYKHNTCTTPRPIMIVEVATQAVTSITNPGTGSHMLPDWSHDGTRIVFNDFGASSLVVAGADGSNPTTIRAISLGVSQAAWSPDDTRIAFTENGVLRLINPDGTNPTQLATSESVGLAAAWSPDGTRILYQALGSGPLRIVQVNGPGDVAITGSNTPRGLDWGVAAPPPPPPPPEDGRIVLATSTGITVMEPNGFGPNAAQVLARSSVMDPAWSPDGEQIAFSGADGIYVMSQDGTGVEQVTSTGQSTGNCHRRPRWAPDGSRIAFYRHSACTSPRPIMIVDLATEQISSITTPGAGFHAFPDWSHDGTRIVFADPFRDPTIYVVNADGTNLIGISSIGGAPRPAWSPDDSRIAYNALDAGSVQRLWLIDPDGSDLTELPTAAGAFVPAWSPDGTRLLYQAQTAASIGALRIIHADGSGDVAITGSLTLTGYDWGAATTSPPPPPDTDGDGVPDASDNCPNVANADQADGDNDGTGDACEPPPPPPDDDGDGVPNDSDNCPNVANADQADGDNDGTGDACEPPPPPPDADGDGIPDATDNCVNVANANQTNTDGDAQGNACDADDDNDGLADLIDIQPLVVSNRFNRNNITVGTVVSVPSYISYVAYPGGWTNGVSWLFTIAPGAVGARSDRIVIQLDGKATRYELQPFVNNFGDVNHCFRNKPCEIQISDPPASLALEVLDGEGTMVVVLNGQTIVITVKDGATATVIEYSNASGVLTDIAIETEGTTGSVLVNDVPLVPGATTTFGRLQAAGKVSRGKTTSLNLSGTFTPGASSNGLNPLTEQVVIRVGPYTWTIAAGSFRLGTDGAYLFDGNLGGVQVSAQIKPARKGSAWTFQVNAVPISSFTLPAATGFRVGDDVGTITP